MILLLLIECLNSKLRNKFTFQFGDFTIRLLAYVYVKDDKFTFQFGDFTMDNLIHSMQIGQHNLHSNLVILL